MLFGYALHLSALIFVGAMVGTSLARYFVKSEVSVTYAAALLTVPSLLLAAHLAFSHRSAANAYSESVPGKGSWSLSRCSYKRSSSSANWWMKALMRSRPKWLARALWWCGSKKPMDSNLNH